MASPTLLHMSQPENRRLHFAYAWPVKNPSRSNRKPAAPPYPGAEPWKCSVYYYWWEYLRRHEGYRRTCEQNGVGAYAELYEDFGDVHATDFWSWWRKHNWIFAEPPIRQVEVAETNDQADDRTLIVKVPLDTKLAINVRQFKRLVGPKMKRANRAKMESRAKYPVATKPVLSSLHEHLSVWDAKQQNPEVADADLADLVGLRINHVVDGETLASRKALKLSTVDIERKLRRRKQLAVQRHLRIAEQYIANVGRGQFPLRDKR